MNPDSPKTPREEMETWLTSLLLGELSAGEAAAVRELIKHDPALAKLHDELKAAIHLVREATTNVTEPAPATPDQPRLSVERREKLLAQFKVVAPKEFAGRNRTSIRLLELAAVLTICAVLAAMLLPSLAKSKAKAERISVMNNLRQLDLAKQQWAVDHQKPAGATPTVNDLKPYLGRGEIPSVAGEKYVLGEVGQPAAAEVGAAEAKKTFGRFGGIFPKADRSDLVRLSADGQVSVVDQGVLTVSTPARPKAQADELAFLPRGFSPAPAATRVGGTKPDATYYRETSRVPPLAGPALTEPPPQPVSVFLPPAESSADNPATVGLAVVPPVEPLEAPHAASVPSRFLGNVPEGLKKSTAPSANQESSEFDNDGKLKLQSGAGGRSNVLHVTVADGQSGGGAMTDTNAVATVVASAAIKDVSQSVGKELAAGQAPPVASADDYLAPLPSAEADLSSASPASPESGPWTTTDERAKVATLAANNRAYAAKQRELQDLVDGQRLLTRKINQESGDLSLPKSGQVEIVDLADARTEPKQTILGGLLNIVSGEVERAARIEVNRDLSGIEESNSVGAQVSNAYDPYFAQTELETIQSDAVLGQAAQLLGLNKIGANKSAAIAQLRKQLELRVVPNTDLVDIRAQAGTPEEAARTANMVAQVYRQWRLDKERALKAGELASLQQASHAQEQKIRQTKTELEALRQAAGIELETVPVRPPATNALIPQPEIQTSENSFSTFSLNVSDVSFKLAAASLEKGQLPDAASIRTEEFINAFDYRDPEPPPGAPIAFAWERARYPFAHNRDLLRFSLKTAAAGRPAGRPLNLVLLLDNSGSMERADRVRIMREALRVLARQLQPQDKLSVITFARTARLVADGISGDKAGAVTEQVAGLTPEGGTNLEEALNLAYQTAARHFLMGGLNRVVLLTDGAANLGDVEPASLKQKVEAARQQGIALDCFGIGWDGYNDDLLEVLSRNGDGRYGFLNSPEAAATDFVGQLAGALKVAASDVKVQVEFNPRRVTSYRQIGYARHQLTQEQFRDNTVDAAEIAAQEAGNALYTVAVNPVGDGPLGAVRVRYKVPGTTDYREQAWDVPFTGSAPALDQSSPAMRLAASAAAFAEWLGASPFAGEVTPDALLGCLRGVPEAFGADSRPKKLEWMIRQAKGLEGK